MKTISLLIAILFSLNVYSQRQDTLKTVEHKYSPGHFFKKAGNNLIAATLIGIGSGILIAVNDDATIIAGGVGEIVSLVEFISAGVNLRKAGKRMIELKMGVMANNNQIGLVLMF
jgi:hypothetical protein